MDEQQWLHIRNWDRFQRFNDRRPTWLRLHLDLHRNDDYLSLSGHRRAILIGLWIEYASRIRRAPDDSFTLCRGLVHNTATLSRQLALKVTTRDLVAVNHAGFTLLLETECVTIRAVSESLEVRDLDKNISARAQDPKTAQAEPARTTSGRPELSCPECPVVFRSQAVLDEHAYHSHDGPEPAHWSREPEPFTLAADDVDLPPPEERQAIAAALRAQFGSSQNGHEPDEELPWEGEEPPVVT